MLVCKSVVASVRPRSFLAMSSALVMIAGMLFGANIATADSVWVQSYERTSQTQACAAQPGETPWQASWGNDSSWSPSWEQWANKGMGGWVCTRSITWARSTPSARSYSLGDIGPGGGLVFLISGGLRYEMAPKEWGVNETTPTAWTTRKATCYAAGSTTANQDCEMNNLYPGTTETQTASTNAAIAVGMGSANTDAIISRMNDGGIIAPDLYAAGAARAYPGGGYSDWFLPSKDELNAMFAYGQTVGFDTAVYGFTPTRYWSSSQANAVNAWNQFIFINGDQSESFKGTNFIIRPIRAF